jgi:hypothetical protein
MNVTAFVNAQFVDKNGYLTDSWRIILSQLLTQLQANFSNEGVVNPSLTTAQIAQLTNMPNGTTVYNSTTDELMCKKAGTFVNI